MTIFGRSYRTGPVTFTSEGSLRDLLRALKRYGLTIEDIPSADLRARLRALEARRVREEIEVARDRAAVHIATTRRGSR